MRDIETFGTGLNNKAATEKSKGVSEARMDFEAITFTLMLVAVSALTNIFFVLLLSLQIALFVDSVRQNCQKFKLGMVKIVKENFFG